MNKIISERVANKNGFRKLRLEAKERKKKRGRKTLWSCKRKWASCGVSFLIIFLDLFCFQTWVSTLCYTDGIFFLKSPQLCLCLSCQYAVLRSSHPYTNCWSYTISYLWDAESQCAVQPDTCCKSRFEKSMSSWVTVGSDSSYCSLPMLIVMVSMTLTLVWFVLIWFAFIWVIIWFSLKVLVMWIIK